MEMRKKITIFFGVLILALGGWFAFQFFKPEGDLTIPATYSYQGKSYVRSIFLDSGFASKKKLTVLSKDQKKPYLSLVKFDDFPVHDLLGIENTNSGWMDSGGQSIYFAHPSENTLSNAFSLLAPKTAAVEISGENGKILQDFKLNTEKTVQLTDYLISTVSKTREINSDPFARGKGFTSVTFAGTKYPELGLSTYFIAGLADNREFVVERIVGQENDKTSKSIIWENVPASIQKIIEKK